MMMIFHFLSFLSLPSTQQLQPFFNFFFHFFLFASLCHPQCSKTFCYCSIFHPFPYISIYSIFAANVYVSCAKYIVEEAAETNYEEFFFFFSIFGEKNVNLIIEKFFAVPIFLFFLCA